MDKKVVLITGGSDGLGKAVAKRLTNNNFQVVILSPTSDKLTAVAKELNCDHVVANVSDFSSMTSAIKEVLNRYGRLDCLINNAGLWIEGELDNNSPEDIEKVIKVNNLGVLFASKAVIPQMKVQKSGLIININSQGGFYAKGERSVYSAAKWGITGFTKSLQSELAKYGIGVTGIYPGKMKTQMFEKMGIQKDMKDGLDPDEVAKVIEFLLNLNPLTVIPEIGIKYITN